MCFLNKQLIYLVAHSSEFENIMVREEEHQELENLRHSVCPLDVRGGSEDKIGKIIILIQVGCQQFSDMLGSKIKVIWI